MSHTEVGRRMTAQGAQEYFLRVVPAMERELSELRGRIEQQNARNESLSEAMSLLTAQLLSAYSECERLRALTGERGSVAAGGDRVYRLFRALIELSPSEVTEYLVRRKDVHAILTGLRAALLPDDGRRG